jgi:transposase-like protein
MKRTVIRYSEAFKLQVVEEVERGCFRTFREAHEKYGIPGHTTVKRWVRSYGKQHLLPRVVRVESMKEKDRIKELKRRNRELEKALADSKVREVLNQAYFEIVCEKFGITDLEGFKKKVDAKLFDEEGFGEGSRS